MVCLGLPRLKWGFQPPFEMSWWSSGPGASVLLLKRHLWWAPGASCTQARMGRAVRGNESPVSEQAELSVVRFTVVLLLGWPELPIKGLGTRLVGQLFLGS